MSEADRIKELESEMLNNAKTARLIIDGLESRLAKAVGALRAIVKLSEDGDVYDMCSNAECKMRDVAEKTIKELEGA